MVTLQRARWALAPVGGQQHPAMKGPQQEALTQSASAKVRIAVRGPMLSCDLAPITLPAVLLVSQVPHSSGRGALGGQCEVVLNRDAVTRAESLCSEAVPPSLVGLGGPGAPRISVTHSSAGRTAGHPGWLWRKGAVLRPDQVRG